LNTESDIPLKQSALAALGNLPGGEADALLQRWLQKLLAGEVKPELQLDVLLAAEKHPTPAIQALLKEHQAKQPADDLTAGYHETLAGGNAANGKKIFFERADVSCLRCHAIKKEGGIVGPPLDGIATKKSRQYLLEAILDPNRTIATGYENLIITRKDGTFVAGTLKGVNETAFIIDSPEDGEVTVPRKDVASRKRGLSAMPEGLGQMLTKQEMRDLIEYLGSLK
jgi:quinoprotein glucose dehydrogenase